MNNNINLDISHNLSTFINEPITNIDIRALFRERILNLLNIELPDNNFNNLINNSLYLPKKQYKKVLSDEGEKLLIFTTFNNNFKEKICPIMQIPFENNDEIIQLPCNHIFNKEGILQWLKEEQSKCPVCRFELPFDEIQIKNIIFNDISSNNISSNDISSNDISSNNISSNVLSNLFNNVINYSNERHNNSPEENLNSFFTPQIRSSNPYSIVRRSLYNRQQEEEEELQRAIWDSLNINPDNNNLSDDECENVD